MSKEDSIELILNNADINEFINAFPSMKAQMYFYMWQIEELRISISEAINYVRILYEEFSHDRKAVALEIKNHKYKSMMFKALDNLDMTSEEIIQSYRLGSICNYINEYERKPI